MQSETLVEEFSRLVREYKQDDGPGGIEAWNLIADFAVDNADALEAALSAAEPHPAPSVAVKDLADAYKAGFDASSQGYNGEVFPEYEADNEWLAQRDSDLSALSAQVQDESEIVDCLLAGKPFVFDPATNFCHADDGGAPEHGIKYVPGAQVQDVTGWQLVPKEPTQEMLERGAESSCSLTIHGAHGVYSSMIAAAPAKQEGGE